MPLSCAKIFFPTTDLLRGTLIPISFSMNRANSVTHFRSYFWNPSTLWIRNSTTFSSSAFPARSPIPRNVKLDQLAPYQYPAREHATDNPKSSCTWVSIFFAPISRRCFTIYGTPYGSPTSGKGTPYPTVSHKRIIQSGSISSNFSISGNTKPSLSARVISSICALVRSPWSTAYCNASVYFFKASSRLPSPILSRI